MALSIDVAQFASTGNAPVNLSSLPNEITPFYESKKDYKNMLEDFQEEIDDLQNMMYAHDRYAMLLIFQAMDAAGKDGTIRHVMSGINPHGVLVHSFKKPTSHELDHDYLWRTTRCLPERGRVGIFNRSYYEEVLVVRVHPGILTGGQRIPQEFTKNVDQVWAQRYEDIRNFETYIARNGIHVIKFFLHLSKEEQRKRFLARIDTPSKNWKFSEADVKERGYWDDYQKAYQEAINHTSAPHAPWYVVPADDKKNMRLIVSQVILNHMRSLDMHYPKVDEERRKELQEIRKQLAD